MIGRRSFLLGLGAAVCAPAIIRPGLLMPVKRVVWPDGVVLNAVAHPGGPIPISRLREMLLPGLIEIALGEGGASRGLQIAAMGRLQRLIDAPAAG